MIDVKDLMVGNFVKTPIGVVEVYNIINDAIIADTRDICYAKGLDGIEVTKEILKKMGFEEYEDLPLERNCYRYWDKDRRYKLEVCDDEDWCNSDRKLTLFVDNSHCMGIGSAEFTYVHELQNLVRINCKADLPITKEVFDGVGNGA